MQFPSAESDLLMFLASVSVSPWARAVQSF
jgi:hypothetical protein